MKIKQLLTSIALIIALTNGALTAADHRPQTTSSKNQLARSDGYWTKEETDFVQFTDKTCPEDQREDWYQYTKYVAEPACTISCAGLFAAAFAVQNKFPISALALAIAGTLATVSHTIPYQSINNVDKFGGLGAVLAVAYDAKLYKMPQLIAALKNKKIIAALLTTGIVKCADTYCARSEQIINCSETFTLLNFLSRNAAAVERKSWHAWIHVLWHVLAAWTAYTILKAS